MASEEEVLTVEDKLFILQLSLQEKLENSRENEDDKLEMIYKYLDSIDDKLKIFVPDFNEGLSWLNVSREISLKRDLHQKVVILDFFTYCCINCMHILPDLHSIEESFPPSKGLAVLGVHSAKFENEKVLTNVADAVLRYDIRHPVVNDPQGIMWNRLQIQCWPTILILGPGNQLLFKLIGEKDIGNLGLYCKATLLYYKNKLDYSPLPIKLLKDSSEVSNLSYPSRVAFMMSENDGPRLAVSDTGHHRILLLSGQGVIKHVVGSGKPGFIDGNFKNCCFRSPQGLAWKGSDCLFVADTENHSIRLVDLVQETVLTIAGNGKMGFDKEGGNDGTSQLLNSPWDLCLASSTDSNTDNILFIAMAGGHQIWAYFLDDGMLLGRAYKKGVCVNFAGTGEEENRNNSYPKRASFAQPSGITLRKANDANELYVADSESSSIRCIVLNTGSVRNVVGGDRDPKNLFAFGDRDGIQINVKLQHPLGVVWCSMKNQLYVADSYNHKVKVVDVNKRECRTLVGIGKAGDKCGSFSDAQFNEPGGLCLFDDKGNALLVADTNNHSLKVIYLAKQEVKELPVVFMTENSSDTVDHGCVAEKVPELQAQKEPVITLPLIKISHGDKVIVILDVKLDDGLSLTEGAPHSFQLRLPGNGCLVADGPINFKVDLNKQPECCLKVQDLNACSGKVQLVAKVAVFVCSKSSLCCFNKFVTFCIPLENAGKKHQQQELVHRVKLKHKITM